MHRQIPWSRLGAEGSVIVVSILLAFWIQAWWEGREERRQEVEHLTALRAELREGLDRIPQASGQLAWATGHHEVLVTQFPGTDLAPTDSLVLWLSSLTWPVQFVPPRAVLDDLLSSGGIQRIRSDPLRISIADYERALEVYALYGDLAWTVSVDRIQPFLEGRVPRVDRLLRGTYPQADRSVPFAPSPFTADFRSLFSSPAFESMIAERWMRLNEAGRHLDGVESSMREILELIHFELGSGSP